MSFVIATPEIMTSAAADLAAIGSNVSAAHMAAAAPTLAVLPAAADEVSASIANLFSQHAASYQAMAAQAAAFPAQFVQHLNSGAFSYASIESALASLLQGFSSSALSAVNEVLSVIEPPLVRLIDFAALVLAVGVYLVDDPLIVLLNAVSQLLPNPHIFGL